MEDELSSTERAQEKYSKSSKGRAVQSKYFKTEKGRLSRDRYQRSEKGQTTQLRYYLSEKGKATRQKQNELKKLMRKLSKKLEGHPDIPLEELL